MVETLQFQSVHHFNPDWNIWTIIRRFTINLGTDYPGPLRINPDDFADPLTFPIVPVAIVFAFKSPVFNFLHVLIAF